MRMTLFTLAAAMSVLPSLVYACNDHAQGTEPKQRATEQRSSMVAGEVREVDVDEGTITLAHDRIASLRMRAMGSMSFKAVDAKLLVNLKPRDKVKFRATIVGGQPTVMEIKLAKK